VLIIDWRRRRASKVIVVLAPATASAAFGVMAIMLSGHGDACERRDG